MQPLFDNLAVIKHRYNMHSQENRLIEDMLKDERLVISALAYIRGRSLSNVFFIVDEAQNLTPHEVKTIITRAGEGVKMVLTGDIDQMVYRICLTVCRGRIFLPTCIWRREREVTWQKWQVTCCKDKN